MFRAHPHYPQRQNPVSSLSSSHCKTTAKPLLQNPPALAQFHSTFRSGNPDNPTSIASHITVSSYTAALSQCHFRSIIQSISHTLQHQEISTFRSVQPASWFHAANSRSDVSSTSIIQQAVKFRRGFWLLPISRCLFTPHFI